MCIALRASDSRQRLLTWSQASFQTTTAFSALTSCAGCRHNMPRPCKLTFNLLTLNQRPQFAYSPY